MTLTLLTPIFTAMAVFSVVTFLLSLFCIPWFIRRLPENYFLQVGEIVSQPWSTSRVLQFLARNTLGVILLVAGIAMLFLPGQGVITIIIGMLLLSFPGKQRLIKSLIKRKRVQKSLNWIRITGKKKPFTWPNE